MRLNILYANFKSPTLLILMNYFTYLGNGMYLTL